MPGEEKDPGRPYCDLSVLKSKKDGETLFSSACCNRMRGND